MSTSVKGFITKDGEAQYDFNALVNTPEIIKSILNMQASVGQHLRVSKLDALGRAIGFTPVDAPAIIEDAVLYTKQELTEEQKAQARKNIGAAISDNAIAHPYTDDECRNAFYSEMNAKVARMNISYATIVGPAGYPEHNFIYPISLVKLTEIASSYRELSEIWSAKEYTIKTHDVENTIQMTSTVTNGEFTSKLTNHYSLLGGKTGSGIDADGVIHSVMVAVCTSPELEGRSIAGVVSLSGAWDNESQSRFAAMKLLMDIAVARYKNRDADVSSLQTQLTTMGMTHGCCFLTPHFAPYNMYSHSMSTDTYHKLYTFGENSRMETFSTIKTLTAMVVLDYVCDLDEHLTFKQSDLLSDDAGPFGAGTGAYFAVGETITIRDALYGLMLPSSNQCAFALARHVGEKLLRLANYSTI